jgi:hypothetical protein
MSRLEQIEAYRTGPDRFRQAWESVPEEARRLRPEQSEWSPHEIVIHLADAEVNGYVRFRKLVAEPGSDIGAYEQDEWADRLDYLSEDPDDALDLIDLLRGLTLTLIERLPATAWTNAARHPEQGTWTLETWLETYTTHVEAHVRQMEEAVAQWASKR